MVELTINYCTDSFDLDMPIDVIIKNESSNESPRILYLLHGYSGNNRSWNRGSTIFQQIRKLKVSYPLYVFMPSTLNSYYTDLSPFYKAKQFIDKELPAFVEQIFPQCQHKPQYTNIAGLSMGGFGALLMGLSYPTRYKHIGSFSGAVDICKRYSSYSYSIGTNKFGLLKKEYSSFKNSNIDLFHLSSKIGEQDKKFSKISMYCGDKDFLIEENREFSAHLEGLSFDLDYSEQIGYEHNWDHWELCLKDWLPKVFVDS